jgi:hypothetical protein
MVCYLSLTHTFSLFSYIYIYISSLSHTFSLLLSFYTCIYIFICISFLSHTLFLSFSLSLSLFLYINAYIYIYIYIYIYEYISFLSHTFSLFLCRFVDRAEGSHHETNARIHRYVKLGCICIFFNMYVYICIKYVYIYATIYICIYICI